MTILKSIKIIRPINLIIIVLTQLLCRWSITNVPFIQTVGVHPMLNNLHFALLVLSTVLIAAGGYIVNDVVDVDIDNVNKPDKMVVSKHITEGNAMKLYFLFTILGLALGAYIAWAIELKKLVMLHVMMVAFLFFYAHFLKQKLLIGNVIVSFCTSFTILILVFFDLDHVHDMNESQGLIYIGTYAALVSYSLFAFLTTLMREIVKDLEDKIGDSDFDCRTVPIVWGDKVAKKIVSGLGVILILIFSLFIVLFFQNQYYKGLFVVLFCLLLPSVFFQYKLFFANEKKQYNQLSLLLKVIMVLGIFTIGLLRNGDAAMIFSSFFDFLGFVKWFQ